jgi:hypothetical protein
VSGQTWTLAFPAPSKMQTANTAKHWATASTARSDFRAATYYRAVQARLPRGLTRVRVEVELHFPTVADRDNSNYAPLVAKPCLDALGRQRRYQITKGKRRGEWVVDPGYGLIPDDNPKKYLHCEDCPHIRISDERGPKPFGVLIVTITDYSEAPLAQ